MDRIEVKYLLFLHRELKEHKLITVGLSLTALPVCFVCKAHYHLTCFLNRKIKISVRSSKTYVFWHKEFLPYLTPLLSLTLWWNLVELTLRLFEDSLQDYRCLCSVLQTCDSSLNSSLCTIPYSSTQNPLSICEHVILTIQISDFFRIL